MNIFFAGAINGHLLEFYDNVEKTETLLGVKADWVLCTGSLGVWPDPRRVDRATSIRGVGDFPRLYLDQWVAPVASLFIAGPHEDHGWLDWRAKKRDLGILPHLTWLMNGFTTTIGTLTTQATH